MGPADFNPGHAMEHATFGDILLERATDDHPGLRFEDSAWTWREFVAEAAVRAADMLIVGGTSLVVYPAASLVRYYRGERLVVINKQPTPADALANLVLHMPIGQALGGPDTAG